MTWQRVKTQSHILPLPKYFMIEGARAWLWKESSRLGVPPRSPFSAVLLLRHVPPPSLRHASLRCPSAVFVHGIPPPRCLSAVSLRIFAIPQCPSRLSAQCPSAVFPRYVSPLYPSAVSIHRRTLPLCPSYACKV